MTKLPPPPSWAVLYSVRQEGGGGATTDLTGTAHRDSVARPCPKNYNHDNNQEGGDDCLPPSKKLCIRRLTCNAEKTHTTETKKRPTTTKNQTTRATRKKKKQEREGDLDVGAEQGVRIEDEERGHEEATLGEPQTPQGVWVSPAPEREREKKREKNVVGEHTKQRKKERGDPNINANKGLVLKGTKPNNISTPETKNAIPTNQT